MKTVEEKLALVIETAYAGLPHMPRHLESEAEEATSLLDRLLKAGWELRPPREEGACPCCYRYLPGGAILGLDTPAPAKGGTDAP